MDVFNVSKRNLFDEAFLKVTPSSSAFRNEVETLLVAKVEAELKSIGGIMYDELRNAISVQAKNFRDRIKPLWCNSKVRYTYSKAINHISGDITFQIDREKAKPPKPPRKPKIRKPRVVAIKGRPSLPHFRRSARGQRKAAAKVRNAAGGDAELLLHATNQAVNCCSIDEDFQQLTPKRQSLGFGKT